ncbi:hypothetical protein [Nocardiopsis sp. FR26]|uniref:hypothetical protein n=1 Tax=Nocardiopsis sp. FR26 TaxID=2605987 RepID=UPI0013586D90|nr:hypothetical protein [Nocardiopsis sp. FR26]
MAWREYRAGSTCTRQWCRELRPKPEPEQVNGQNKDKEMSGANEKPYWARNNFLLYTIAALGALAILFAIGWGLWVRGVEFASWVSGIGGTLITITTLFVALLKRPTSEDPATAEPSESPGDGTAPNDNSPSRGSQATSGSVFNNRGDAIMGSGNSIRTNSAITALAIVATVGIVAIALAIFLFPSPAEGRVCERPTSSTGEDLETQMFQVVYTEGMGFVARCGQGAQYAKSRTQDLYDGQFVSIVCQDPNGLLVSDPGNQAFPDGYPRESTIWHLLIDGRWISDLYVNTPKGEDVALEDKIRDCGPDVLVETTAA